MQNTQGSSLETKTVLTIVFPGQVRQERVATNFQESVVLTPAEAFVVTSRGVRQMPEAQRAEREKRLRQSVLAILRGRAASGFKAAALGEGKAGETVIEKVAVELDGVRAQLGIDPATGRVLGLSYRGRGMDGTLGEIAYTFSDFRNVDGLTLPFKMTATFNGGAVPEISYTVESITVNAKVDPATFDKPKAASAQ